MPTNWLITANVNGITSEIIGTGTEDGLSYIDIKVSGTPTATGGVTIGLEATTQVVASDAQTWTLSSYLRLAAGSTSNAATSVGVQGRTSVGASIAGQDTRVSVALTSSALKTQRQTATRTMSDATVGRAYPYALVAYTNAQAIDLTLRIAAPQLEQGAFPTSYIPTTSAAATRSADSAVVTPISSFYNQAEGTLFAEHICNIANVGIVGFTDNSVANRFIVLTANSPAGAPIGNVRISSNAEASITVGSTPTSTEILRFALTGATNDFQAARGGTLGTADTSGDMPTLTHLQVGVSGGSSNRMTGHIRKIAYWPRRLSNTLLQQLTT
jgi:hypothetical protein